MTDKVSDGFLIADSACLGPPSEGVSPRGSVDCMLEATPPGSPPLNPLELPIQPPRRPSSLLEVEMHRRTSYVDALQQWDLDGDGKISYTEAIQAARGHLRNQREIRHLRFYVAAAVVGVCAILASLLGVVLAGNELTKDFKPNDTAVLEVRAGTPVATAKVTRSLTASQLHLASLGTLQNLRHVTLSMDSRLEHYRVTGWTREDARPKGPMLIVYTARGDVLYIDSTGVRVGDVHNTNNKYRVLSSNTDGVADTDGTVGSSDPSNTECQLVGTFHGDTGPPPGWVHYGLIYQQNDMATVTAWQPGSAGYHAGFQYRQFLHHVGTLYKYTMRIRSSVPGVQVRIKLGLTQSPYTEIVFQHYSSEISNPSDAFTLSTDFITVEREVAGHALCAQEGDCSLTIFVGYSSQAIDIDDVTLCPRHTTCAPQCTDKECGPDGCGGTCGECPTGQTCGGTDMWAPQRCIATCPHGTSSTPAASTLSGVKGVCYSPWGTYYGVMPTGHTLMGDIGGIRTRLGVNDQSALWIRTYGSSGPLRLIPEIAAASGVQTFVGAWVNCPVETLPCLNPTTNECEVYETGSQCRAGFTDFYAEIDEAATRARCHSKVLVVGSEVLERNNNVTSAAFISILALVRARHPDLLLAVAETSRALGRTDGLSGLPYITDAQRSELSDTVDIILVNVYPYWAHVYSGYRYPSYTGDLPSDVRKFSDYVELELLGTRASYPDKVVLLGEMGQPSSGVTPHALYATPVGQAACLAPVLNTSWATGFLFTYTDEPWKAVEGHVERHFGLLKVDRDPKPVVPDIKHWLAGDALPSRSPPGCD